MEPARPALPQARTDASALTPASPADAGREPPPDPVHPGLPEQGQDGRVHPVSAPPRPAPEGLAGVTHAPEGALGGQHAAPSGPHGAAGGERAAVADAAVALRAVGTRPGTVSSRYDLEGQTEQVHDLAATPTHRSDAQRCHTHPGCSSIGLSFLRLGDLVSSQHLFRGWGSRRPGAGVTWICPHSLQTDQVAPLPWAPPFQRFVVEREPSPCLALSRVVECSAPCSVSSVLRVLVPGAWLQGRDVLGELSFCFGSACGFAHSLRASYLPAGTSRSCTGTWSTWPRSQTPTRTCSPCSPL